MRWAASRGFIFLRSTALSKMERACWSPPVMASWRMSFMRTRIPLAAASWAIPPPMTPAPRTPTVETGWGWTEGSATPVPFRAASRMWKTWIRFFETVPTTSSLAALASASRPLSTSFPRVSRRIARIRRGAG